MGGWCFELNGIFHWLLSEVGFNVDITGSSTRTATGTWRNAKDHMILIVHIDNRAYLSDVGFGMYKVSDTELINCKNRFILMFQMPYNPIEIFDGSISDQPNGSFKITQEEQFWMLSYQRLDDDHKWDVVYRFRSDWPKKLSDFQAIHEIYTYGREPLNIGLISKPMAQVLCSYTSDTIVRKYLNESC